MLYFLYRILGLCLLQNELCPITLNRHVIKVLLGRKVRENAVFIMYFCTIRPCYMMLVLFRMNLLKLLIIFVTAGELARLCIL